MRTAILGFLVTTAAWIGSAQTPAAAPLKPAGPFTIMRVGAPPIQLSQLKGKLTVLAFIHTTCPHCQALTTTLGPISKDYTPKNVQFIECAFNQNADTLVSAFVGQFNPPFPVGYSNDTAVRGFLQYSVMDTRMFYVPHMVFIDANGMIRSDYPGESQFFLNPNTNIREELDKLIKAGAATAAPAHTTASSKKK